MVPAVFQSEKGCHKVFKFCKFLFVVAAFVNYQIVVFRKVVLKSGWYGIYQVRVKGEERLFSLFTIH